MRIQDRHHIVPGALPAVSCVVSLSAAISRLHSATRQQYSGSVQLLLAACSGNDYGASELRQFEYLAENFIAYAVAVLSVREAT